MRSLMLALGLTLAVATTSVGAANDAPVHDRYVATAHCMKNYAAGGILDRGIPVSAIMRDDGDAIDAALQRVEDLRMVCDRITVEVVYLP